MAQEPKLLKAMFALPEVEGPGPHEINGNPFEKEACSGGSSYSVNCCGQDWLVTSLPPQGVSVTCSGGSIVVTFDNPNCPELVWACGYST